jgi:hypothetical protein
MIITTDTGVLADAAFSLTASTLSGDDSTVADPRTQIVSITKPISYDDAIMLVLGKTEKLHGVDPARQLGVGDNGRSVLRIGVLPLSMFKDNEEGDLYDGTVNRARAEEYRDRPSEDVPPVIAVLSPRSGKLNILDGGHRISAARMRGDSTIFTIVSLKSQ